MLVFSVTLTALLAVLGPPPVSAQNCEFGTITDLTVDETAPEGYFVVLDESGIFTGRARLSDYSVKLQRTAQFLMYRDRLKNRP